MDTTGMFTVKGEQYATEMLLERKIHCESLYLDINQFFTPNTMKHFRFLVLKTTALASGAELARYGPYEKTIISASVDFLPQTGTSDILQQKLSIRAKTFAEDSEDIKYKVS